MYANVCSHAFYISTHRCYTILLLIFHEFGWWIGKWRWRKQNTIIRHTHSLQIECIMHNIIAFGEYRNGNGNSNIDYSLQLILPFICLYICRQYYLLLGYQPSNIHTIQLPFVIKFSAYLKWIKSHTSRKTNRIVHQSNCIAT